MTYSAVDGLYFSYYLGFYCYTSFNVYHLSPINTGSRGCPVGGSFPFVFHDVHTLHFQGEPAARMCLSLKLQLAKTPALLHVLLGIVPASV